MGCELIRFNDGATAIICGGKKDHECDSDGPELVFNNSGQYFDVKDRPDWKTDPDEWGKWMDDRNICGGCVSCSICGEPFTPSMF